MAYEINAISSDQPLQGPALDISGPDDMRSSHENEREEQAERQPEDPWAGDSARMTPPPSPPDPRDEVEVERCLRSLLEPAAAMSSMSTPHVPPAAGQAAPVWPATSGNRPGLSSVQSDPSGWPSLGASGSSKSAQATPRAMKASQHGRVGAATTSAQSQASAVAKPGTGKGKEKDKEPEKGEEEEEERQQQAPLGINATERATALMVRLAEEDKLRPAMDILTKVIREARGVLV